MSSLSKNNEITLLLLCYVLEAVGSISEFSLKYYTYYHKKYARALTHKQERALTLIGQKFIYFIYHLITQLLQFLRLLKD